MIEQGIKRSREDDDEGEPAAAEPEPKRLETEREGNGTAEPGTTTAAPEAPLPAGGPVSTASEAQPSELAPAGTDPVNANGDGMGSAVPEEQTTKSVGVPDGMVGKIIGKQGSTIRQIQDVSGAHMDIAKACEPGAFERIVTVTGTPSAVAKCEVSAWLPPVFLCGGPPPTGRRKDAQGSC